MSHGTGSSGAGGTTGEPGTTAVDPGTSGEPMTTTSTSTTGEPGSTGDTTGPIDEQTLCAQALAGDPGVLAVKIRDLGATMCDASWRSSDLQDLNNSNDLKCPTDTELGIVGSAEPISISPDQQFAWAMLTGPRKSPTGTVEGLFSPTPLGAAGHPCLLTRLGCPVDLESCSLDVQISIKGAGQKEFDKPLLEVAVGESGAVDVAIPLAAFKGETIDILLVAANDGAGEGNQEVVAWELPRIVDVSPP
jgi:hypothetical protein